MSLQVNALLKDLKETEPAFLSSLPVESPDSLIDDFLRELNQYGQVIRPGLKERWDSRDDHSVSSVPVFTHRSYDARRKAHREERKRVAEKQSLISFTTNPFSPLLQVGHSPQDEGFDAA